MSESVSQLKVGAALDGSFETVTQTVKTKLKELSNTAKDTGDKLSGMGDGTTQSAQKVEQATKSMVSSIQRTTALMDSGARGSVEYYKALANQRGIDSNVLKPYLDQLEAVKVKQAQASAAMLSGGQSLDKIGMSAAATANALRGVPAQFTDIVTSIQGGQAPLTVFLQQGGQLKDMFGGAGNAAKALGGYVLGLINPFTLVAAGVAAAGIAYMKGAAESEAYNKALILTGSAAGVTAGQLGKMAQAVSSATGGTIGASADALAQLAGAGNIASAQFERVAAVAIQMEKTTGQAVKETVKEFSALGKDPLDASIKLNAEINFLTQSVYEQIKALTEQGRTFEAGALAQKAYEDAMNERFPKLIENLGIAERAWAGVGGAAKKAWDQFLNIGRTGDPVKDVADAMKSAQDRLTMLVNQAKNAKGYDRIGANADVAAQEVIVASLKKQADYNASIESSKGRSAAYAARQAESTKAQIEFDKEADKYLSKSVQMQQAIASAQERFSKVSQSTENLARYTAEIEGIKKKFEEAADPKIAKAIRDAAKLKADNAKADIAAFHEMDKLRTKSQGDEMKRIADLAKAETKRLADGAVAYGKELDARAIASADTEKVAYDYAQTVEASIKRTEFEIGLIGQTEKARATAIGQYEIQLRLEKQILEIKKSTADQDVKNAAISSVEASAIREKAAVSNRVIVDEWKKTSDSIQNTLTDALMRGFESGKDFAKNLRDTLLNMFKTMVLRPIISAVINPVAGALTGALGLSGAAQAAGTGSSVLSSVGTIAGLASTFGAGLKAGFAGLMGEAGLMGTLSAGTTAIGAGNIAGGLGTLGGPLALATAAILGLSAIIKATSGETRNGAKYGVGTDGKAVKLEGPSGGEIASIQTRRMFDAAKTSIEEMLKGLGSKAVLTGYVAALESSENGKGFAYATGAINGKAFGDTNTFNNMRGDKTAEQAIKDYHLNLSQSILEALQVTEDLPASVAELISKGLNDNAVKDLSLEATNAILETVSKLTAEVNSFNEIMLLLPFESLKNLSFDAAAGLGKAAGGFDKLGASLSSYYDNFYSEQEKTANLTASTSDAFAKLGVVMPSLDESGRALYRSMVEQAAANLDGSESADKFYAKLLALNPAFSNAADAVASAMEKIKTSTESANSVLVTMGLTTSYANSQRIAESAYQSAIKSRPGLIGYSQEELVGFASDPAKRSDLDQSTWVVIDTLVGAIGDWNAAQNTERDRLRSEAEKAGKAAADVAKEAADAAQELIKASQQITKELTDAGASLGVELLKAQGKTAEAAAAQRAIETTGYNAAQIALYDYNQTLRDQITALGEATALQARIAAERTGLQDQYDTLTMTSAELLTKQRNALDESNRALFDSINAIKAETVAKDAATKAAAAAFATLKSAVGSLESARTGVASGYSAIDGKAQATSNAVDSAELAITNGYIAALDRVSELNKQAALEMRGFADSLRDFIKQMSMSDLGGSSKASQYAAMQADFATTAAQARAGDKTAYGQLTGKAQSLLAAGKEQSVTATDYARLAGSVGGTLEELATLADGKAGPFAEAIDPLIEAQKDLAKWSEAASQSGASTSRTVADYLTEWRTATTANEAAQKELKEAQKITQGIDLRLVTVLEQLALAVGTYDNAKTAVVTAGGSSEINTIQDLYQVNLGRAADTEGLAFWTKAFMQDGVIDASERQQFAISAMPEYLAKMGRSFAAGTNYVPHDMTAQIHKGEAIIPTAYNPFNPSAKGSGDTARLEALIDGLTQEVIGLRAEAQATAGHTSKTARLLDRAMPYGDALAIRTVA